MKVLKITLYMFKTFWNILKFFEEFGVMRMKFESWYIYYLIFGVDDDHYTSRLTYILIWSRF